MKFSQVLKKVIKLGEAIRKYWDRELPKRFPNYPWVNPGEEDEYGPPPPEKEALRELLASLPEDMIYKLKLITSLGWGNLASRDLEKDYLALKERFDSPEEAASDLLENGSLGDYLSDGLAELNQHKINVDKLSFNHQTSRK